MLKHLVLGVQWATVVAYSERKAELTGKNMTSLKTTDKSFFVFEPFLSALFFKKPK